MTSELPPPPGFDAPVPAPRRERNPAAIAAFILGLLSLPLFLYVLPSILAIILAIVGWRNAFYGAPHRGLALWGWGLGSMGLLLFVGFWSTPG
jgi:hypothetical protein